ncbi:hypothetical protein DR950_36005 [Kitasatospora xanthocidica]|uniref:Uncharacterized protein n=1 Tax=Kitasatospora xanthocidica TaxID=83382 RepID=A0A373A323_9ACTN|nr:hypothetical protein [Kitasatospora xanthocidica]RGD62441.1 hypothetical protein DR950_36005 [Kitasatospora xanthocidica]
MSATAEEEGVIGAAKAFVEIWAQTALVVIDDYGCTYTCDEADVLAELFRACNWNETADDLIREHAADDGCLEEHPGYGGEVEAA